MGKDILYTNLRAIQPRSLMYVCINVCIEAEWGE